MNERAGSGVSIPVTTVSGQHKPAVEPVAATHREPVGQPF